MFSRRILKLPASITPAAIAASRYWFGRTPSAPAGRSRAVVTRALPKACVIVGDRGPNARLWGPEKQCRIVAFGAYGQGAQGDCLGGHDYADRQTKASRDDRAGGLSDRCGARRPWPPCLRRDMCALRPRHPARRRGPSYRDGELRPPQLLTAVRAGSRLGSSPEGHGRYTGREGDAADGALRATYSPRLSRPSSITGIVRWLSAMRLSYACGSIGRRAARCSNRPASHRRAVAR